VAPRKSQPIQIEDNEPAKSPVKETAFDKRIAEIIDHIKAEGLLSAA